MDFTLNNVSDGDGTSYPRGYSVYRPSGLTNSPSNKVPAVLIFDGGGNCGGNEPMIELNNTRVAPLADDNRFIAVFMLKRSSPSCVSQWRKPGILGSPPGSPSDEPYTAAVIADILVKQNVDPQRIYATGASSGGAMVLDIACDPGNSPKMRGVSVVSSTFSVGNSGGMPVGMPNCASNNKNLFIQQIVGTTSIDANIGMCPANCLLGAHELAAYWAQHLGCPLTKQNTVYGMPTATNQRERYTGACAFATNYAVEDLVVVGGGHGYQCHDSGGPKPPGCGVSGTIPPTNGEWDLSQMWDFFAKGISQ